MRDLTKKQKDLLTKWYKQNEPTSFEKCALDKINPIRSADDLTNEQYDELVKINDTEILYQNVNAFLWDLRFKDL